MAFLNIALHDVAATTPELGGSPAAGTLLGTALAEARAALATCSGGRCGSAIDGVYTGTRSMAEEFPELVGVNPYYVPGGGPGVNTNCASCVNAAVARLTRRNPSAVADPSSGYARRNDLLPSAPFGFAGPTTPSGVSARLAREGDGAVAVVTIPQANGVEHSIIGINRGGDIQFIDPQLGAIVQLRPNLTVIPGYN